MKNILIVLAVVCYGTCLQAQNEIQFGFQLSPTISWLTTNDSKINSNGSNLGLKLGMIGEVYFRENYSITTGIGFHFNAGGSLFYEGSIDTVRIWTEAEIPGSNIGYDGDSDFKYSLQYVEIPIGLKLRTKEFGYVRYYVEPQLSLGFRTQSRGNITVKDGSVDPEEDYDIKTGVNPINLSWGIGGGLEYTVSSNTALFGGLAFQSGFTDVSKDKRAAIIVDGAESEDDSKAALRSIVLRLGVMF